MIRAVVCFFWVAHQFLPERPLVWGDDVSERLVAFIKGYRVGGLFRSHYDMDAGIRVAGVQRQPFRYPHTIEDL